MYQISLSSPMPILMAGRFSQKSGWEHSGRKLDHSFLFYLEKGTCTFVADSNRMELTSGDILLVPKGTFYAPLTQEGCTYLYFHFAAEVAASSGTRPAARNCHYSELIESSPAVFYVPERLQADSSMVYSMQTILNELTHSDPISGVRMNLAFFQLLLRMHETAFRQTGLSLAFEMETWLRQNAQSALTLESLVSHFGYTRQYLIRVFRKQFGTTPMAFLNEFRLSLCIPWLLDSVLSLDDIAHRCGFEDSNYFSRQFKKKYHLPPSIYRKRMTIEHPI